MAQLCVFVTQPARWSMSRYVPPITRPTPTNVPWRQQHARAISVLELLDQESVVRICKKTVYKLSPSCFSILLVYKSNF